MSSVRSLQFRMFRCTNTTCSTPAICRDQIGFAAGHVGVWDRGACPSLASHDHSGGHPGSRPKPFLLPRTLLCPPSRPSNLESHSLHESWPTRWSPQDAPYPQAPTLRSSRGASTRSRQLRSTTCTAPSGLRDSLRTSLPRNTGICGQVGKRFS